MRKTVDLDELLSPLGNKADNRQPTFPTPLEISLVNLDDPNLVGRNPATKPVASVIHEVSID